MAKRLVANEGAPENNSHTPSNPATNLPHEFAALEPCLALMFKPSSLCPPFGNMLCAVAWVPEAEPWLSLLFCHACNVLCHACNVLLPPMLHVCHPTLDEECLGGASAVCAAGMAPPTAATAVQVPVHEGEDMDGEGGRGDGPSGSRAAFPSCSSIAHRPFFGEAHPWQRQMRIQPYRMVHCTCAHPDQTLSHLVLNF
eukprot:1159827-Pelagomonas_calceolata.AAC.1